MYKRLIPVLFFIGSAAAAIAQPTLTAATINPIIGDQFIVINCDTAVSPQSGGTSQVWDFSSLSPLSFSPPSADTVRAEIPSWTPHGSLFPSSNVVLYTITTSPTSVSIYNIATATAFSQDGVYYNSSSQYAQYTDPMDALHFPFTYLNNYTDNYAGTILFMGTIPATESGTIDVVYDGYGTLTLPGLIPGLSAPVTYSNVARVHSTQNYIDHASLFGVDTTATYQLQTYAWYLPGYHNALLTIAAGTGAAGNFKAVTYSAFEDPTHESVSSIINTDAALSLFPNPVNDELNIKYTTVNNEQVRISLADMLGREVAVITDGYTQGAQQVSYNTTALPKGLYLVRFQTGAENVTGKVEIQ